MVITHSPPLTSSSRSTSSDKSESNEEWELLGTAAEGLQNASTMEEHELKDAPIFTRDAIRCGSSTPQYGVLGRALACHSKKDAYTFQDSRVYLNTNAPMSALVCGVQGSGKSHTVAVILENMFISSCSLLGTLTKPLSGLVLHFGEGGAGSSPCEAAWIGVSNHPSIKAPPVKVYVSRSSLNTMKGIYAPLTLQGNVTVEPLSFDESELDAAAFLSLMAVGSSDGAPLYIQIVLSILRELGESFSYQAFMTQLELKKKNFNPAQLAGLEQRLALLNSFMAGRKTKKNKWETFTEHKRRFAPGELTVVDLSDPFIDPASACGLFEVLTRLFVRADVKTGKVLVVDEAHKYLTSSNHQSGFTKALLSLTRQQRHLAMRVIISTQEPTVVNPILLDLCTVTILHRFSSPAWWQHLEKHVSADFTDNDAFDKVVRLQTGEAIVLAPSGLVTFPSPISGESHSVGQIGRRYLILKTRKRVTVDGGASIRVVD
ncbi:hypothetical protein J3R30DRAFT_1939294 [Lentinula aciculospora]|uniref:Zona occludens toxin N-terminal domain-containing protein n=1 Tax=Lentinula aciculospora TaxID=153920 RepID=A0A9W8ZUV7_9AGAR|nr:hypothetical protein J3R30DRAFT_1939294 [Lentinula aciculospora]